MNKRDLIILRGAPGSGKSTLAKRLQVALKSPEAHFGYLRNFHLQGKGQKVWVYPDPKEKRMSLDNFLHILNNYSKHGYKNVIVHDLGDEEIIKIMRHFRRSRVIVLRLIVDNKVLRKRILGRLGGWKNVKLALKWNEVLTAGPLLKNEVRIDANKSARSVLQQALKRI